MTQSTEKPLILVIEDEPDIRNMLVHLIKASGFRVLSAESGEDGLKLAQEHQPDLITLDRMLPGIDGIEVCTRLRANSDTAHIYVIMVTALGESDDRIDGLEVGADDYVPKPFENRELILRIQAAVRRIARVPEVQENSSEKKFGLLRIDNEKHRIWIDEEEVNMTITEYKLLMFLLTNIDKLCSRGDLLQEVWELPPTLNTRTVDTHIKRLRQKMGKAADYIQTVRGAGYRFSVVD